MGNSHATGLRLWASIENGLRCVRCVLSTVSKINEVTIHESFAKKRKKYIILTFFCAGF